MMGCMNGGEHRTSTEKAMSEKAEMLSIVALNLHRPFYSTTLVSMCDSTYARLIELVLRKS